MAEHVNQVTTEATQQAAATTTQPSAPTASGDTMSGTFSSLGALKAQYPKFYKAFMLGMALQICTLSQQQNDRYMEQMQRERAAEQET